MSPALTSASRQPGPEDLSEDGHEGLLDGGQVAGVVTDEPRDGLEEVVVERRVLRVLRDLRAMRQRGGSRFAC